MKCRIDWEERNWCQYTWHWSWVWSHWPNLHSHWPIILFQSPPNLQVKLKTFGLSATQEKRWWETGHIDDGGGGGGGNGGGDGEKLTSCGWAQSRSHCARKQGWSPSSSRCPSCWRATWGQYLWHNLRIKTLASEKNTVYTWCTI